MSFAADLIRNPNTQMASKPAPVAAPAPAPQKDVRRESVLGESLVTRLDESFTKQKSLVLSAQEVVALRQYIEMAESDPFTNTRPVLDTNDLSKLELNVDQNEMGDEERDPFSQTGEREPDRPESDVVSIDRLSVELAIVAPDATPYHDEPIPASVLAALEVLQSDGAEQSAAGLVHTSVVPPAHVAPPAPPAHPPTSTGMVTAAEAVARFSPSLAAHMGGTTITEKKAPGSAPGPVFGAPTDIRNFMGNFRKAVKESRQN